ncbi:MAG: hypothetical protein LGL72_08440 [Acidibrevibacterium sp.]|jgi:hypothetical protein|uniref:hypothetical protein n=1 Tax=Acidibrevibacterium fodinaquatile TaxID=1969806 RepID=UPI0023A80D3E|nr:hypothetical protein [Acidibrevibacterium fodinaquatile]MCA7119423.1 hypothetical protein [Acidibrevibacterium fodinaquatile]
MFFFEKKEPKNFYPLGRACGSPAPRNQEESFFASFSSEKEESSSKYTRAKWTQHDPPSPSY